ncbi:DedA family protein [Ramlibacter tataouinensis]|uniref:Candidate membrane protein n=1 Tax=Ramlibacter tataouinensis (strain ATCC BAA-407 / DSM 14655 / LMG 21543 / TTB310) TaxID=365046 RepID=F5Y6A2_RAMTT|nr:DedA family protein [Ramlibacter tataouinensis]AEG92788.1 candidate membrane protein [Ramlibacter tataouinensis TTB310]
MSGWIDQAWTALHTLQGPPAYGLVLGLLVASGFFLPVNEDLLLVAAAALTLKGLMQPPLLVLVAWAGIVTADALVFHWGRVFGARALENRWAARVLPPARLARAQAAIRRWGPLCIMAARFLPGLRTPIYFAAGSLRLPYRQLFLYDGAAAAAEIPLVVYAVRWFGER